jgi:hypothetical protein
LYFSKYFFAKSKYFYRIDYITFVSVFTIKRRNHFWSFSKNEVCKKGKEKIEVQHGFFMTSKARKGIVNEK